MIACNRGRQNLHAWDDTTRFEAPDRLVDGRPFLVPAPSDDAPGASVALCLTPKAASTTIKRHVLQSLAERGVPLQADWKRCPHGQPAFRGLNATPVTSLMVVRHPLARLASAYDEVVRRGFWHRLPQVVPNATFAQVVYALSRAPPRQINAHFRPLWLTCGLVGGRRYAQTLKYEQWDALAEVLRRDVAPGLPRLAFSRDPRASDTRSRALYATPELVSLSNQWARTDLRLFGYAPLRL